MAQSSLATSESTTVTEVKMTCVRQDSPTGSHFPGKKLCHTDAEWRQIRANAQQDMRYLQDRSDNDNQGRALASGQ